ncbi:hypothetical protein [Methylobacterium sp. CM6257]
MMDGATLKALHSEFMADETSATTQVDAAAILASIWARNALRREAQLPLLPVRATFEREWRQARWSVHVEQHYAATRERVLAEKRPKHGQGWELSVRGGWGAHLLTMKILRASFPKTTATI